MRYIVDVRQRTRDQDIPPAFFRENWNAFVASNLCVRSADCGLSLSWATTSGGFGESAIIDEAKLGGDCLQRCLNFLVDELGGGFQVGKGKRSQVSRAL